jgi:hypothetical protein
MTSAMLVCLYLAALAGLLGLEVIRKAPPTLHTSLMAAVGAMSGLGGLAAFSVGGAHGALAGVGGAVGAAAVVGGLLGARRILR